MSLQDVLHRIPDLRPSAGVRQMWRHFISSIFLLAIALLCALYSSGAARSGRLGATFVSAILALAISVWVSVRFVPKLARSVDWNWLPFMSRYKIRYEGWIFLGTVAVVAFAAINTNNNLLYMVLSALLAVMMLAAVLATQNFRQLVVEARLPTRLHAGTSAPVTIAVRNEKYVFPSFSLHIERVADAAVRLPRTFLPFVAARATEVRVLDTPFVKRGRYGIRQLKLHSRFPFGFFNKSVQVQVQGDCLCYPEILPLDELHTSVLDLLGTSPQTSRGSGYDLHAIRGYFPSDPIRHVHWKASAKTGNLMTREFAADESRRVRLMFDRYSSTADHEAFESLVSQAASMAYYLVQEGIDVAFAADDFQVEFGRGVEHLEAIWAYLALVEGSSNAPAIDSETGDPGIHLTLRSAPEGKA